MTGYRTVMVGTDGSESSLRAVDRAAEVDRAAAVGATDVELVPRVGAPVDTLVRMVDEARADLLVVGNRGLNRLAGRLLGSVPSDVARQASCDVLIVHTT